MKIYKILIDTDTDTWILTEVDTDTDTLNTYNLK